MTDAQEQPDDAQPRTTHPTRPRSGRRLDQLDAVRGLAALVVVVGHIGVFTDSSILGSRAFALSPLHLIEAGNSAVVVFFVLSGLVLTIPVLRSRRDHVSSRALWSPYYPRRLVRLYLPSWGALALGFALVTWASTVVHAPPGSPIALASAAPSLRDLAHGVVFLSGSGTIDPPLWSLSLEVIASLALPLVIVLVLATRPRTPWKLLIVLLLSPLVCAASLQNGTVLVAFVTGALLALVQLRRSRGPATWSGSRWVAVLVVSALLLNTAPWLDLLSLPSKAASGILGLTRILGALGVVAVALFWEPACRFLMLKPLQWLGSRSFSLYLVHFPVLVIIGALLLTGRSSGLYTPIALAGALAAAEVFYRVVERPSHRLSQGVGRRVAKRNAERGAVA